MKKSKKTAMMAAAFAVAMGLTACVPPSDDKEIEVRRKSDDSRETEDVQVVYGPPEDFDPSESEVYDVYGPAPDTDDVSE